MLAWTIHETCGCIRRIVREAEGSVGEWSTLIAVCIGRHLCGHQVSESYFGKMAGQEEDALPYMLALHFSERIGLETTH